MTDIDLIEEALTYSVIGAFFEVYNQLGFGFLEQVYLNALEQELIARGHKLRREVTVRVHYKGRVIGRHRLDMIVDDKLVVEAKSTFRLNESDPRTVYAYLHATKLEVALSSISVQRRNSTASFHLTPFHPMNPPNPSNPHIRVDA